jgi:hypothetical protein
LLALQIELSRWATIWHYALLQRVTDEEEIHPDGVSTFLSSSSMNRHSRQWLGGSKPYLVLTLCCHTLSSLLLQHLVLTLRSNIFYPPCAAGHADE